MIYEIMAAPGCGWFAQACIIIARLTEVKQSLFYTLRHNK